MLRFAIVGGLDNYHAWVFGALLNGFDPDKWEGKPDVQALGRVAGAEVAGCWSPDPQEAVAFQEACLVPTVYSDLEACLGQVDGVLVPDDGTLEHARFAEPFLAKGVPVLVDKPLEHRPDRIRALLAQLEQNGNAFTGSALPFHPRLIAMKEELAQQPYAIQASGPDMEGKPLLFYALHTLSVVYAVMGCGVEEVHAHSRGKHTEILLRYANDASAQILVSKVWVPFSLSVLTEKGRSSLVISDQDYYLPMLQAFVDMAGGAGNPVDAGETEEIFRTVFAAEESLRAGSAISTKGLL